MPDYAFISKYKNAEAIHDFLSCCLNRDSNKRASAEELLEHQWLNVQSVARDSREEVSEAELAAIVSNFWDL